MSLMNTVYWIAGMALVLAVIKIAEQNRARGKRAGTGGLEGNVESSPESNLKAVKKRVLTEREQVFFWRLVEACKEKRLVVLAQVGLEGFLKMNIKSRNFISQKRCDFLVCDMAFNPIAVIELDDSSHNGKAMEDAKRDEIARNAGIEPMRFDHVPEQERLNALMDAVEKFVEDMK